MAKKSDALEKTAPAGALARPDFVPRSTEGVEHITRDDIVLPRIAIAQQMSPQLVRTDSKFIEDLEVGDMFNTLTGEIYGPGPFNFHVVRADRPRGVEFFPRDSGGGVKDFNVPLTDPRMQFRTGDDGKSLPPIATKFYDYVVVRLPIPAAEAAIEAILALSMKGTAIKVARQFNTFIKMRNAALYAGRYSLRTVLEKNAKGQYYNFAIQNAGYPDTPEELATLERIFNDIKDKQFKIEREPSDETDFPAED